MSEKFLEELARETAGICHASFCPGEDQVAATAWFPAQQAILTALQQVRREALENVIPMPERDDIGWIANLTMACIDEGVDRPTAERMAARFMGWLTPDIPDKIKSLSNSYLAGLIEGVALAFGDNLAAKLREAAERLRSQETAKETE